MELITTIIPVYNAEKFIRDTIASALAQTHVAQELIVVDDGSTDATLELLRGFGDRIRLIQQSNRGPAAARNAGARAANGQWLAFLDADDLWSTEKIERQLALAVEMGAGLVYTDRENFGDCGHVAKLQSDGVTLAEGDVFESLLLENFITLSSVLISRDLFWQLGGFDESPDMKAVEDWDLWIRVAAEQMIALCREPLTKYRWHSGGISRNVDRMRNNLFRVLDRAFALPRGRTLSQLKKRQARAAAWSVVGWEASRVRPSSAVPYFASALLCDPFQLMGWKQLVKSCVGRC